MRRLISGAVHNPVAANLLMVVIIVVGGMSAYNLRRETFPRISFDTIQVQTLFPGATPEEVEESIVVKIEEAIKSVEGIQDITSQAREGSGVVLARLKPGMDNRRALEDIQSEVEKIDTFPDDAEPTRFAELKERRKVINVAIHGEQPERTLKEVASRVRDDLLASEFISQVRLIGTRDYEISIEVSEASLRRHGLTFDEIRQVVQRSSLNLPGGSIKTPAQDIVVRTAGQRYTGLEFALLPLLTRPDGTVVTLDEVARVSDGFVDAWRIGRFNGAPSVLVSLFRTSEEDALVISDDRAPVRRRAGAAAAGGVVHERLGGRFGHYQKPPGAAEPQRAAGPVPGAPQPVAVHEPAAGALGGGGPGGGAAGRFVDPVPVRRHPQHDHHVRLHHGARHAGGRCHRGGREHLQPLASPARPRCGRPSTAPAKWPCRSSGRYRPPWRRSCRCSSWRASWANSLP